jgi:hypothetical protein
MKLLTTEEIKKLAEELWTHCDGCDENDKYFWINGFVMGHLQARIDDADDKIKSYQDSLGINNLKK